MKINVSQQRTWTRETERKKDEEDKEERPKGWPRSVGSTEMGHVLNVGSQAFILS